VKLASPPLARTMTDRLYGFQLERGAPPNTAHIVAIDGGTRWMVEGRVDRGGMSIRRKGSTRVCGVWREWLPPYMDAYHIHFGLPIGDYTMQTTDPFWMGPHKCVYALHFYITCVGVRLKYLD
jgi:hypothetical protein